MTDASPRLTAPAFPEPFLEALRFASERHARQLRKGSAVPYITHPVIVAETLAYRYPRRPELVVAGVLHDVVEDTAATLGEVEATFGARVARLVAVVTKPDGDDPALPRAQPARWRAQREAMLRYLDEARPGDRTDALRLKAADTLANLRALARDLDAGIDAWERLKAGRGGSLWYYGEVVQRVRAGIADEPLADDLDAVFADLAG